MHRTQLSPGAGAASGGDTTGERVIEGEPAPVHEGMAVKDSTGSKIGSMVHATFQTDGNVEFFIVEYGLIFKKQKQLPGDMIGSIDDDIHLRIEKSEFDILQDIGEE